MQDRDQNNFYDTLTGLALKNGGYSWNKIPISDGEPGGFIISKPQSVLNREAAKALRRTSELVGAEPNVTTQEHAGAAPRNPFSTPARVMPATKGRPLQERLFKPREDTGPLAGLSTNEFADAALELFDAIDKRKRARDKKLRDERAPHGDNRFPPTRRQRDDDDVEQHGRTRVAGDSRSAAFDAMPLTEENLYTWHSWLAKKLSMTGAAAKHFGNLRTFLRREGLSQKKFGELAWQEKVVLERLVEKLVEVAA